MVDARKKKDGIVLLKPWSATSFFEKRCEMYKINRFKLALVYDFSGDVCVDPGFDAGVYELGKSCSEK